MYYTVEAPEHISIIKLNTATGQSEELLSKNMSLVLMNDYIYMDNDTVYYFVPKIGLYAITYSEIKLLLDRAEDCVIFDNTLYYTKGENIDGDEGTTGTRGRFYRHTLGTRGREDSGTEILSRQ